MEQQISSDLIRGHIDTIILHTLISSDKFAQQISDFIEEKSNNEYKINQATLYSSLKRLESLKYVKSYWNDSDAGRRKYFSLTESGKECVENNTSNWSYSRAIIDRLMDCAPQPVYNTEYVEKIVEVPVEKIVEVTKEVPVQVEIVKEIPVISPENTIAKPSEIPQNISPIVFDDSKNIKKANENALNKTETIQEINFRNILNGLIKATTVQNKPVYEQLEPLQKQDFAEKPQKPQSVDKFNETLFATDYNAERNNNGKIDFGDLTLKAAKEGFKIRISSKELYVEKGTLLISKLNFFSTFSVCVLAILAVLAICFNFATDTIYNKIVFWSGIIIPSVVTLISAIIYAISHAKTINKRIYPDSILTATIVAFDILLITVATNLLLNVDFTNLNVIMYTLVLPIAVCALSIAFFALRLLFSKSKRFMTKIKK